MTCSPSTPWLYSPAGTIIAVNVANAGLTGTDAGNYVSALTTGSTMANITQKALTVTGSAATSKTYDGSNSATVAAGTASGFVDAETVLATVTGGTFSDQHAATNKTVTLAYSLADGINGGLVSNYSLANDVATTNITARTLTSTLTNTGVTKVDDGITSAPAGFTPTWGITGFASGDTGAALSKYWQQLQQRSCRHRQQGDRRQLVHYWYY